MSLPAFYEPVSICLSRVLEDIGVNVDTVRKRRKLYHEAEKIREIGFRLTSKNIKIYHFGSKIEGSTTLGLKSDVDLVYIHPNLYTVVESRSEKTSSLLNLMLVKDAPVGHCKLTVVSDISSNNIKEHLHNSKGRYFLPNKNIDESENIGKSRLLPRLQHGPSSYYMNTDNIRAISVSPSMSMVNAISNRFKCYIWPAKKLIDKMRKAQYLLVPIGHPQSENTNIEWRISYSFAERMLIFDFNITQLRCLVLLKMVKKTFFHTVVGDEFTSYHCKTTLFHTIAMTRPSLWKEDSLYHCLMRCLSTLQLFLFNNYCPHFFDQNINLFVGKLTYFQCKRLGMIVKSFLNDKLQILLHIQTDDIGARLQNVQTILGKSGFPSRDSVEKQMLIHIEHERHRFLIEYSRLPYINMLHSHPTLKKQIYTGFKLIKELLYIMTHDNGTEHAAARLFVPYFASKHASLLSAYRMKQKQPVTDDIIDIFKIGFQTDATSTRLKLASVLYCNGKLIKAMEILNEVEDKLSSSLLPTCLQIVFTFAFDWEEFYKTITDNPTQCRDRFSSCVEYMRNDIWCCPLGLRRSLITHDTYRQDICSFGIKFGKEVDSKTILYYLKYCTYAELRCQSKTEALRTLMQCVMGNSCEWYNYFFDITNGEEEEIVYKFRDRVFQYPDKYIDSFHETVTPELFNSLEVEPWGSIRLCICYAFHKCSVVQHMDMALLLIGYCHEREGNNQFASAFYWMSFIVEPSSAKAQHILRICPDPLISEYFNNLYSGLSRMTYTKKLEVGLIPIIVEAFVNFLEANIGLGVLLKADLLADTYRARFYISILNALVRKYARQEKDP